MSNAQALKNPAANKSQCRFLDSLVCPHLFLWIQFSHVYPQMGLHAYAPCKSIKTCQDGLVSLALLNAIYHTRNQQKRTGNEWSLIISAGFVVKSVKHAFFISVLPSNEMLYSHSIFCVGSPRFPHFGMPHIDELQ